LAGAGYALSAFSLWGLYPLYFKALSDVPAFEVLSHRVVWTVVFLFFVLLVMKRIKEVRGILADRKTLKLLTLSSILVSGNWLIFIWAIANDRALEASLGYYINPLVSVALGFFFLGERLSRWKTVAVALAVTGVLFMIVQAGQIPWVALSLSLLFAFYGLVRKVVPVGSFSGLFVETLVILPPFMGYLIYIEMTGTGALGRHDLQTDILLLLAGILTATPLILFALAAKRLALSSVGFFQYITPTLQFLIAVFVFSEPFTFAHLITFGFIWLALSIYTADTLLARNR